MRTPKPPPGPLAGTAAARTAAGAVIAVLAGALAAGCGSRPTAARPGPAAAPAAPPPLATSYADAAGAGRVIVEMGGPAAQNDNFWELFVRPAGWAQWRLATPLGVADNGGIAVAGAGRSLVTGFRPSQDLTFSPLAASGDGGASWSAAGLVSPGLAGTPDALAAGPGGRLIALTSGGRAELGTGTGTGTGTAWARLSSVGALAATAAGQACGLTGLTGATFGSGGIPMLAASCSRPGVAGIFADRGGTWRAAGPAVPASLSGKDIGTLRLAAASTRAGDGVVALLRAGSGSDASLVTAWSDGQGGPWRLSAPLRIGASQLRATSVGPDGAIGVILERDRGEILAGPGSSWRALPALPAWAAALTLGPGARVDAIAAHAGTFSDWRLTPGTTAKGTPVTGTGRWSRVQTIHVTIPYGSSG